MDTFRTVKDIAKGNFTEKRSKFISYAIPVETVEDVKNELEKYRKEFYDARHICWAYMLGPERKEFRANDDGEPSGTAGKPILGQINSNELTDVLILVIRYFGGIKLGTSGLIVAYREAALEAIKNAEIIEKTVDLDISFYFEYP
ncbi:MAG TPA: YigZ family protein, partial [Dysgonomonas sp.]|nr:YigZ family protein [Dysgonomonas sp.]